MKVVMAFSGAVLATFVAGSIFATQFILSNVSDMNMEVTAGVRLHATLHDLAGLSMSYLPMIAVAFLIALLVAAGLAKLFPAQRMFLYVLAGAVGVIAIHVVGALHVLRVESLVALDDLAGH